MLGELTRESGLGTVLGYGVRVRCVSKGSECFGARELDLTVLRTLSGDCML